MTPKEFETWLIEVLSEVYEQDEGEPYHMVTYPLSFSDGGILNYDTGVIVRMQGEASERTHEFRVTIQEAR